MLYDVNAELCALWKIHSGELSILRQLEADDFYDADTKRIFVATQKCAEKCGEINMFVINELLINESKPSLWWNELILSCVFMGSDVQIVSTLKRMRARREAAGFKAKGKDEELPAEFIGKGREIESLLQNKENNWEYIVKSIENPPRILPTGFGTFDYLSKGGIREGGMLVIAANPGTGKTTLAVNIAKNVISQGQSVHFVSLEMPEEDVVMRFMQCFWKENSDNVRTKIRDMSVSDLRADFSVGNPNRNINRVIADMTSNIEKDLFIVDYFGLIEIASREGQVQRLEQISNMLQGFAMESRKPLVVVSQLNRDIEKDRTNREPQLSDIRGTGALAQDAHIVSFLWDAAAKEQARNTLVDMDGSTKEHDLKWVIKKNRYGENGTISMDFDYKTMSFSEVQL